MLWRPVGLAVGALFVLAGCGGGGGGGGDNTNLPLTLSLAAIGKTVAQIDLPTTVTVNASVQGTTTASTLYIIIVDPTATFTGVPAVTQNGPMQYQASLRLSNDLTFGTHSGTLQVSICGDAACANVLGKTTAPFTITVAQNPMVTGTWSRTSISLAAVSGDPPASWAINLLTPNEPYIPYAQFSDPANIVSVAGGSQTLLAPWGLSTVQLTVASTVAPGTYTGNLNMVYCRDQPCKQMYGGITQLPYSVVVYPASNTKALTPLSGAADWPVWQGSPAHTGYVPVTLNAANFTPRWKWSLPNAVLFVTDALTAPVTSGGKVFTAATPQGTVTPNLYAIDETSGLPDWQQPIPDTGNSPTNFPDSSPPAIAGGNVYIARIVGAATPPVGQFFGFSVADGTAAFAPQTFPNEPVEFSEPVYLTPRNGTMLLEVADSQFSKSFVKADLTTGVTTPEWATCPAAAGGAYANSAAVDSSGKGYLITGNGLLLPDTCVTIAYNLPLTIGSGPAVVPGTSDVIAVGNGNLVDFDTTTQQIKWSANKSNTDDFEGTAAIAGTTVYALNQGQVQLEARDESTGQVLWTWHPLWQDETGFPSKNLVVTNNLVFLSTNERTYAIDTTTHQIAWIYPYLAKHLAISANGVLYIHRQGLVAGAFGESLDAINLQ